MKKLITILVLAVIIFTGCWDKVEIEQRGFVVAVGIDRDEDEYSVTLIVPLMDGEKGDNAKNIQTAKGKTVSHAISKLDTRNSRQLYFGQTKILLLGEKLLENGEMARNAVSTMKGKLRATRRVRVVAAESVKDVLSANPRAEIIAGSYISNIYRDKDKIGGTSFTLTFERLTSLLSETNCIILPKIECHNDELILSGARILPTGGESFELSTAKLRGLMWCVSGGNKGAVLPDFAVQVEKHSADVRFEVLGEGGALRVVVELQVAVRGTDGEGGLSGGNGSNGERGLNDRNGSTSEGDLDGGGGLNGSNGESNLNGSNGSNGERDLNSEISREISSEILKTAEFLQEKGTDVYYWLEHLRKSDYGLYKEISGAWGEVFREIEVVPRVNVWYDEA